MSQAAAALLGCRELMIGRAASGVAKGSSQIRQQAVLPRSARKRRENYVHSVRTCQLPGDNYWHRESLTAVLLACCRGTTFRAAAECNSTALWERAQVNRKNIPAARPFSGLAAAPHLHGTGRFRKPSESSQVIVAALYAQCPSSARFWQIWRVSIRNGRSPIMRQGHAHLFQSASAS